MDNTPHTLQIFLTFILEFCFQRLLYKGKKKKIKKLKAYLGFANETQADSKIVDNSLYNKKQKANYLY